jgi:two-component system sensor kinase
VAALESGGEEAEAQALARVYDLAYHFDAAGEKRKGWIYGLLAAEQARRQSALEVAVNNYALAKRNSGETANAVRYRIAEGYGEALMLLGRYEEANEQLPGVIDLVEDAERKARIEALQGEIAFKQALIDRSIAIYERGLGRLGVWVPRTSLGLVVGLLREAIIQGTHSLWPSRLHQQASTGRGELVIRLLNRITHPILFRNTVKLAWVAFSGMNRAELLPPSRQLTSCYGLHSTIMSMLGWSRRGATYGDRAIAIARARNDLFGLGLSCNYKGIGLYAAARYEAGLAVLAEAVAAFEKMGDFSELHFAHFHRGCCHFGLGNLAQAIAAARWVFASSARLGDSRTMCSSWLWARATRGNIPFDELKSCIPCRPDDIMSTVHALLAEGYWHTFHGRTAEALQVYERAAEMVRKSLCVNSHTILVMPMLAMGLRLHAEAMQPQDAQQAEQLRKRAYRVAKWATRLTSLFPAAYPLALRERALILAAYGKTKKALKFADKSCAVADAQKAKFEHAQSLLVRGKLAKELGLPEAEEQIRSAEVALDAIERPVREAAARQASGATPATQPDSVRQKPVEPAQPAEAAPPVAPRRSLVGPVVAVLVALVGAVLVGQLLGWCTGYVLGFVSGAVVGNLQGGTEAGVGLGAALGRVALPVLALAGWLLVRWGLRHYEATAPWRSGGKPTPPPAPVRYGLFVVLGVGLLGLWMIPAALGIGLGGILASACGANSGPWATAMPALGGALGLALPFLVWRRAR